jgi:hypothetical protein
MKKVILASIVLSVSHFLVAQNVGIGTTTPTQARLEVHTNRAANELQSELLVHNTAPTFTRMRFRNNTLGFWDVSARIGSLVSPALDTFKITTDLEPNFFIMRGNGQIGINTSNPLFRLHIEGQGRPALFARSSNNATDSGAIMAILDVPVPTQPYSAAIRGEHRSTTLNGIGVFGRQEGGGWGVFGLAKELGIGGYGAGVCGRIIGGTGGFGVRGENYNTNGAGGYFIDLSGGSVGHALQTDGKLRFASIGEGAGKVLTSDALGNATWQSIGGSHNHFGEIWTGSGNTGLRINNESSAVGPRTVQIVNNANTANFNIALESQTNSTTGIGLVATQSAGTGIFAPLLLGAGIQGIAGNGIGVAAVSTLGPSLYAYKNNGAAFTGTVAKFENLNASNTATVVEIANSAGGNALDINNGYLKVSGTNKTAFRVTATGSNSTGHILRLSYNNPQPTDIVIATHLYGIPGSGPFSYHNQPFGVYWDNNTWCVYNENTGVSILDRSFNVLIIRQ